MEYLSALCNTKLQNGVGHLRYPNFRRFEGAQERFQGLKARTDDWRGYSGLDRLGYRRQIARSSAEVGENLLPLANRVASLLKRWLLGTRQGAVSAAHLD
jgi:hypothetical protein